jgi:hypothetical protein
MRLAAALLLVCLATAARSELPLDCAPAQLTSVRLNAKALALPAIQAQIDRFLRPDGRVEQFCTGPCDPE